ncbi:hypothetical protein AAFP30_22375 [Gordonia sp. CPCC 205515]|uniref:hypothetical protein n=1 Tax=Gordonia sp. CPCC 205515 TaxID=3140791 RepID=UPI003AF37FDC
MTDRDANVRILHRHLMNRVEVDPNQAHGDGRVYLALVGDFNGHRDPSVGETVIAVQPEPGDEPDYVSTAQVVDIDRDRGLIMLAVDWQGFHDEVLAIGGGSSRGSDSSVYSPQLISL